MLKQERDSAIKMLGAGLGYRRMTELVTNWDKELTQDDMEYLLTVNSNRSEICVLVTKFLSRPDFAPGVNNIKFCISHPFDRFRELLLVNYSVKLNPKQIFKVLKNDPSDTVRKSVASRVDFLPTEEMIKWSFENDFDVSGHEFIKRKDCYFSNKELRKLFDVGTYSMQLSILQRVEFHPTKKQIAYGLDESRNHPEILTRLFKQRIGEWTAKAESRSLKSLIGLSVVTPTVKNVL